MQQLQCKIKYDFVGKKTTRRRKMMRKNENCFYLENLEKNIAWKEINEYNKINDNGCQACAIYFPFGSCITLMTETIKIQMMLHWIRMCMEFKFIFCRSFE